MAGLEYIPDQPYNKILTIGCSRSGKTDALIKSRNHQLDTNKIYL